MATVTGLYNDYWRLPRIKPNYEAGLASMDKIVAFKNQQYEQAYSYINSLKSASMNIQLMNKTYQDRVDGYNKELDNLFLKDDLRGKDLGNADIANKYIGWFDKLGKDTELLQVVKYDSNIKKEYARIKEMAKNPAKTGYADANMTVWLNSEGGLKDYIDAKDSSFLNTNTPVFSPYYDVWKDISTILKNAIPTESGYDIPDNQGGMISVSRKELSEGRLAGLFSLLPSQAVEQLKINEKAQFYNELNSVPEENRSQYLESIKGKLIKNKDIIYKANLKQQENSLAGIERDIKVLESNKQFADADAKKEELRKLQQEKNRYEVEGKPDIDQLKGVSKHDIANMYGDFNAQLQMMAFASNLAHTSEVQAHKIDPNYWAVKNYNFNAGKEEWDQYMDQQRLALDQSKATLSANGVTGNITIDPETKLPVMSTLTEGGNSKMNVNNYAVLDGQIKSIDTLLGVLTKSATLPDGNLFDVVNSLSQNVDQFGNVLGAGSELVKDIRSAINESGIPQNKVIADMTPQEKAIAEKQIRGIIESKAFKDKHQIELQLLTKYKNVLTNRQIDATKLGVDSFNKTIGVGSGVKLEVKGNTVAWFYNGKFYSGNDRKNIPNYNQINTQLQSLVSAQV